MIKVLLKYLRNNVILVCLFACLFLLVLMMPPNQLVGLSVNQSSNN